MDKPLVGLSPHYCLSLEFLLVILLLVWSLVTPHSLFISIQAVSSTLNSQTPQIHMPGLQLVHISTQSGGTYPEHFFQKQPCHCLYLHATPHPAPAHFIFS